MEENVVFKSKAMKSIMKQDSITLKEFQKAYHNIEINGEKLNLDYDYEERKAFIEDITKLQNFSTKDSITDIRIKNMDLEGDPELSNAITSIAQMADYIRIDNSKFDSVENAFQKIFGKESVKNDTLSKHNTISMFSYDKFEKKLSIDSESIKFLEDYKQYVDTKNLILEASSDQAKQDIIDNIDILREHKEGHIFLKDTSPDKNITDLSKYESYANGNIVLFKSKIIKETMGFDKLPTDAGIGITYNLRVDGQKLLEQGMYKLEGKELELFLNDLQEISKYCPLSGISIKNIAIPDGHDLNSISETLGTVNRINIENSYIPELKEAINGIKNKNKVETIKIKESGLDLEDIDIVDFPNISSLSVEKAKHLQSDNEIIFPTEQEIKEPWYKRAWDKVKGLPGIKNLFKNGEIKALPEAILPNHTIIETKKAKDSYIEELRKGVNRNIDPNTLQTQTQQTQKEKIEERGEDR